MVIIVSNLQVSDCPRKKTVQVLSTPSPHRPGLPSGLGASLNSVRSWLVQHIFESRAESWRLFFLCQYFLETLMCLLFHLCSRAVGSFSMTPLKLDHIVPAKSPRYDQKIARELMFLVFFAIFCVFFSFVCIYFCFLSL